MVLKNSGQRNLWSSVALRLLMLLSSPPWILVLCQLSTAVPVGYKDVLHGDYFH